MVCYLRVKVMSYWRWLVCWCGYGADLVAGQASTWFLHFFLSPDDRSLPRPSAYPSSDISTLSNHAQKMGGAVLHSGTLQLHKALCLLVTSSCWISACTWRVFLGGTFGNLAVFTNLCPLQCAGFFTHPILLTAGRHCPRIGRHFETESPLIKMSSRKQTT